MKKEKVRGVYISETRSGRVIKEKYGSFLLWRKELHPESNFFMLDLKRMFCKCGNLISLPEKRRVFVQFGKIEVQTIVCELCNNVNKYEFMESQKNV